MGETKEKMKLILTYDLTDCTAERIDGLKARMAAFPKEVAGYVAFTFYRLPVSAELVDEPDLNDLHKEQAASD